MPAAKLTSPGQLVIPKPVRQHLRLQPGDRVDFVIRDDGEVVVQPVGDVRHPSQTRRSRVSRRDEQCHPQPGKGRTGARAGCRQTAPLRSASMSETAESEADRVTEKRAGGAPSRLSG